MKEKSIDFDDRKPPLIDREEELDKLMSFVENVSDKDVRTIFILGEPGMGKTRLLEELKKKAAKQDYVVLEGNCEENKNRPFLPLQKAWKGTKGTALPSLKHLNGEEDVEITDKEMLDAHRNAAFYETAEKLREDVKENPHLLILEDIQWADEGSLNLFHYLSDRLNDEPVLLIATYQPGDLVSQSPLKEVIELMSRKDLYEELELDPLSHKGVEKMVMNFLDVKEVPDEFLEELCDKTNCNPLLIKETIGQMIKAGELSLDEEDIPEFDEEFIIPEIRGVVKRRISRLDKSTRETLQLGSVIGREIPFSLLSKASNKNELDLLDQIEKLQDHGLWITRSETEDEVFRFTHEMISRVIYEGIGEWVEKQSLHGDVANAIKDEYDDNLEEKYSVLAGHYERAEDYEKALKFYLKSAEKAEEMFSHEDAIKRYEDALEALDKLTDKEDKRVDILEEIGKLYRLMGEYQKSKDILYRALNHISEFEKTQKIYLEIIKSHQTHGKFEEALKIAENRLSLHEKDDQIKGELLSRKGGCLGKMGRFEEAQDIYEKELEIAKEIEDDELLAQAYHDSGTNEMDRRKFEAAEENLKKAKSLWEELDDLKGTSNALNNIAGVYFYTGDYEIALEEFKNCLEIDEKRGDKYSITILENNIGLAYQKIGCLDKALAHFEKAFKLSSKIENRFQKSHLLVNTGLTYMEKGDMDEAKEYIERGHKIASQVEHLDKKIQSEFLLGKIEVKRDNIKKASKYLDRLVETSAEREVRRDKGLAKYLEGLIEWKKKELEKSRQKINDSIQIFEETNSKEIRAKTLYELGKILEEEGHKDEAEKKFDKALEYFESSNMKSWSEKIKNNHRV